MNVATLLGAAFMAFALLLTLATMAFTLARIAAREQSGQKLSISEIDWLNAVEDEAGVDTGAEEAATVRALAREL